MFEKVKNYFNWDEVCIFQEICQTFTFITVINSFMMILSIDTPKVGEFAYVHILMRLLIISIIILIFDFRYIPQEIKQTINSIKNVSKLSGKEIAMRVYRNIIREKFNTITTIFTLLTIVICLFNIFIVREPKGGTRFYFSLLILWGIITIAVLLMWFLHRVIKKKNNEIYKEEYDEGK